MMLVMLMMMMVVSANGSGVSCKGNAADRK
jgi:hypothetical protein